MKRNLMLVAVPLLGAAAVGGLLLLSGGGPQGARAGQDGKRELAANPAATGATSSAGTRKGAEGGPAPVRLPMKTPTAAVQPGMREPFDSEETRAARERNAGRIEELIHGMTNPNLTLDQRRALSKELQDLLREMGHRVSPGVRQSLLRMLSAAEPMWKDAVASALGSLRGDTETATALLDMLQSTPEDVHTRRAIYSALGMMRCPEVTPTLMAMLGEGYPDEHLVIKTIGALAGPEELEQLFARLDKPLLSDSRTAIENVLRERGRTKDLLDKVAAGLDTTDAQKRRSLLRILQASNDPAHAERIRELLKGETDGASRALAIQALGKYGDVDSGKVLMGLIQGGTQEDRDRAIQAIHSVQNQDTIALLASDYPRLGTDARVAVMGAISRLTAPNEDLLKLAQEDGLRDSDLRVRNSSARALGKLGRDQGVEALVMFLERSTHPAERSSAFAALETIRTNKAALAAIGALRVVPNDRQRDQWEQRFRKIAEDTKEIRRTEPPG